MLKSKQLLLTTAMMGSILCLVASASASTFYKWVDANGSTHYSQTPPKSNKSHSRKVEIDATHPVTATAPQNSTSNQTPEVAPVAQPNQTQTAPITVPQIINNGPKSGSLLMTQPPQQQGSNGTTPRPTFANPQQSTNATGGLDRAL